MPRYFFEIQDGGAFVADEDGTELADLAAARIAMAELAGNLLKDGAQPFWKHPDWRVSMKDEAGALLLELRLSATESGD